MKQHRILISLLAIAVLLSLFLVPVHADQTDPFSQFRDLPAQSGWSYDGIQFCVENGYMNGFSTTEFSPSTNLTRAQLVTILYRMEGSPVAEFTGRFEDVEDGLYYSLPIEWAASMGIVNGIDETHFAPNQDITRQQIAAILYRHYGDANLLPSLEVFPDHGQVDEYAETPMRWCVQAKLINGVSEDGVSYLRPRNNATREQIATILMRLVNIVQYEVSVEAYKDLDNYMIAKRITTDINAITAPYVDSFGALPNDADTVEEVSRQIFDWSLQLKEAGIIKGSSYNTQGRTVAFFLPDDTTYVYFPQVDQCYSGSDDTFSVMSVTSLGLIDDVVITGLNAMDDWFSTTGANDAAKAIKENAPACTNHINITNSKTGVDEMKDTLAGLAENDVRVLFWRSHGNVYTDSNGTVQTAFTINEKVSKKKDEKYADDRNAGGAIPQTLVKSDDHYAINGNFFQEYMCNMPGGLFYCGACQSANGNLSTIVLGKGFESYCGSSGDIFTFYSDDMMTTVAENLSTPDENGIYPTITEALADAKDTVGEDCLGIEVVLFNADNNKPFQLTSYLDAYAKVLREKGSSYTFCLSHIDDDNIPELLLFQGFQHFAQVEVYTYYDGKACYIGSYPEYGEIYFSYKNNAIFSRYMQMGIYISGYFGIKDGKEVHVGDEGDKKFDKMEFMHLTYFGAETCNTKNINAMLRDVSKFIRKP